MAGSVTISGTISTVPPGSAEIDATLTPTPSNLIEILNLVLASGANTIAVPTWATSVLIEPSSANVEGLTLKGVTGDTGIAISPTQPTLLSFPVTTPANIVLTAAGLFITQTTITFF